MKSNIIVLDLETKSMFGDVNGRHPEKLGISVIGTYLYAEERFRIFREEEIGALEELLTRNPLLVGFNIKKFDLAVLRPYLHMNPSLLPAVDIMDDMAKVLGHRVSLESVATATLGAGKSGSGVDAVRFYRNGEWDKLEKYCLDDVRVTKEIFEYGAEHGEVFYIDKYSKTKKGVAVCWKLRHDEPGGEQYSLF